MKRFLLFYALVAICSQVKAQFRNSVISPEQTDVLRTLRAVNNYRYAGKTTSASPRWFSYSTYFDIETTTSLAVTHYSMPYIWRDTMAIVQGAGSSWQHNKLGSVGMVSDLTFAGFNNIDYFPGETHVRAIDTFVIDSIRFFGYYGFNPARAYVDTLRVTFCFAPATADTQAIFPLAITDTVVLSRLGLSATGAPLCYGLRYDAANKTAAGATVITKDVLLDNTGPSPAWGDTVYGVHQIGVRLSAAGVTVPAGSLIGASITFLSGDPGFVPHDTLETSFGHYKYSVFRPFCIYRGDPSVPSTFTPLFPHYYTTDRNNGVFKTLPDGSDGWGERYTPMWYMSDPSGGPTWLQYPAIDFHLASCATCPPGVYTLETPKVSNSYLPTVQPNPATNDIDFRLPTGWQGQTNVVITDLAGRVLLNETAVTHNNIFHCSTKDLVPGMYLYRLRLGDKVFSGKFSVVR